MPNRVTRKPSTTKSIIGRGLWALAGACHGPAAVSGWAAVLLGAFEPERFGTCLALTAATLFCALKTLDIACLRFRADRRSRVAFLLAIAFLHVELFTPGEELAIVSECSQVVGATLLVLSVDSIRGVARRALLAAHSIHTVNAPHPASSDTVYLDAFRPHCWVLSSHLFALRAPPV